MKYKITKVFRTFKDKEGKPLKTSDGREYERVAIKVSEFGNQWVSGFGGNWNANWKEGDTVEIDIEQKGQYLNFNRPNPIKVLEEKFRNLELRVQALEHKAPAVKEETQDDLPPVEEYEDEIDVKNLPF